MENLLKTIGGVVVGAAIVAAIAAAAIETKSYLDNHQVVTQAPVKIEPK